jgi:hypothetical protein
MMNPRLVQVSTFVVLAVAAAAPRGVLLAQAAQGAQDQVQLAFGYQCGDRFLVRNDGAQAVTIEYGITGAEQRSSLLLKGKDAVEVSSAANGALELWVNGKIVATEQKGNRPCAAEQTGGYDEARPAGYDQAGPVVIVRPIEPAEYGYGAPGYYAPRVVYVAAEPGLDYGLPAVVVTPLFRNGAGFGGINGAGFGGGINGAGFGGGARVSAPGSVSRLNEPGRGAGFTAPRRFDDGGVGRPVPNHVEPRRPVQQNASSWRSPQQSTSSWRSPQHNTSSQRSSQQSGSRGRSSHQESNSGRSRGTQTDHSSRSHHHR